MKLLLAPMLVTKYSDRLQNIASLVSTLDCRRGCVPSTMLVAAAEETLFAFDMYANEWEMTT